MPPEIDWMFLSSGLRRVNAARILMTDVNLSCEFWDDIRMMLKMLEFFC